MNPFANTSLWQTLGTVIGLIILFVTTFMTSNGCKALPDGTFDCSAASLPLWLLPYVGGIGLVIMVLKLVVSWFSGKLITPTAPITTSGQPGTVTPSQVAATTKPAS